MSKSAAKQVSTAAVVEFDSAAAVRELTLAVKNERKAGARVVAAVVAFRDNALDEKQAKAWVTEAYIAAGFDEKSKTLANRRSDALAIFRAPTLPAPLPASLQAAAKQCREREDYKAMSAKAGRSGAKAGTRAPKAGGKAPAGEPAKAAENAKAPSADVAPVTLDSARAELAEHVNKLKARAADEETLSLLAELADILA